MYFELNILFCSIVFQALRKKEKLCKTSLDLIRTRELYLSKEEYNASTSRIELKLAPVNDGKWKQIKYSPLNMVSTLTKCSITKAAV